MKAQLEVRVSPKEVWRAWERNYEAKGEKLESGTKGKVQGVRYEISDVDPGKQFSVVWKTLLVKLIFTQQVAQIPIGSLISYEVGFKGLFAWPIRWMLKNRIRKSLSSALQSLAQQIG